MLTEQERKALLHFTHSPSVFNDTRLRSLASSITNGRINPVSREESVRCILLHADSLLSVLRSKKVTAAVLLKYLHELNVPTPGNADKEALLHKILYSEWNFPPPTPLQSNSMTMPGTNSSENASNMGNVPTNNHMNQSGGLPPFHIAQPTTNSFCQFNSQSLQSTGTIPFANSAQTSCLQYSGQSVMNPQTSIPPNNSLQVYNNATRPNISPYAETISNHHLAKEVSSLAFDDFMVNFAKQFYDLLNNQAGGYFHALNQSHFFDECKIRIQIKGETEDIEQTAESVTDVLKLLSDLRQEHNLLFNPNLTAEGIRGKTDSHGLIYAVASGTLHHGVGKLVGVYEQSFILRKDPFEQNSCKIADTTLILRSNSSVNTFSQLLLPTSGRSNQRNFAIQDAPPSSNQLQLTYHS